MSRVALPLACVAALLVAAPVRADDQTTVKPKLPRNQRPTATVAWAPAPPHSGDAVTFSAATSDPDGDPVTVDWDINDDGRFESTGPTAVGRWTSPGTRFFNVRLTDAGGA